MCVLGWCVVCVCVLFGLVSCCVVVVLFDVFSVCADVGSVRGALIW